MVDETIPGANIASADQTSFAPPEQGTTVGTVAQQPPAADDSGASNDVVVDSGSAADLTAGEPGEQPEGPKKRRRRGSRGGRGRNKPRAQVTGEAGEPGDDLDLEDGLDGDEGDTQGGDDYTDAAADRGLTSDDLAEEAREDMRPRIGDTRPAPTPASSASLQSGDSDSETPSPARKRRRRGGRRHRRSSGSGAQGAESQGSGSKGSGVAGGGASVKSAASSAARLSTEADHQAEAERILDELDEEVRERRKGRTRKGRPTGRYLMCVHSRPGIATQIAVLEGRSLVEHYVSRPHDADTAIDGNIYLGKVQNVLPGMEAAFVDIGTPKNGVLYRGDVSFDTSEVEGDRPRIERLLRNGQSVVVQVTKNPIGAKGARLTQEVSLAGRFVVMVPGQPETYGISKRLPDDERRRLRKVLDDLRPADAGIIVRTAAEGATSDELARDVRRLQGQWDAISKTVERARPAMLLHQEPDLVTRVIREEFTKDYRGVVIDDRELYEQVRDYIGAITPELADRVEFYEDSLPIFERFHVHEQLHKALDRKVWLPSGGSLVIERTEALTVIDVNTGKNVGKSNLEETVYRNNLEAAEEVARQLRLRDIGGIIVIDFIDMEIKKNRDDVLRVFKDGLARDKTRTQVFDISELGLVEMTRKRVSEGLVESFSQTCPVCVGRGIVLDESLL